LRASLPLAVGWQLLAVIGAIASDWVSGTIEGIAATRFDWLANEHLSLSTVVQRKEVARRFLMKEKVFIWSGVAVVFLSAIALVSGGSVSVQLPDGVSIYIEAATENTAKIAP
jgi:hypothetical protein